MFGVYADSNENARTGHVRNFLYHSHRANARCVACSQILQDYFKNDTLAMIGYGSQGHGQGLNARDNGLNVIVGVRKDGESWKQAQADGWVCLSILFQSEQNLLQYCISGPRADPVSNRRSH